MKKLLLILFLLPLLAISQNERKIALVIGNANYEDPNGVLTNPLNDSKLMESTFIELEFDSIIVANDLNYDEMRSAFSNYKRALRNDFDVGFIYYSGHGTQDDYTNSYLIPVDFPSNPTIDDVEESAYDFQSFLRSLEKIEGKLNIIILDACRNNPFEKGWKGKSLTGKGLAEPENPANGTLIAYSTAAGYVANDNSDQNNSLYTLTLSEVMKVPNQKIEDIFKKVRSIVRKESEKLGKIQSPQLYGEYDGDLYLLVKEDYSKIEIKTLQTNAESEKEKGNIKAAIDKYTILEIYLKGNMENIDKQKLIKVYLDMGQIYYQMSDYDFPESEPAKFFEENKENWDDSYLEEYYSIHDKYLAKSSNAFLNAKLLLDNESFDTKKSIDHYSEALYKYLRCQSYLDYSNRGIDKETFIKYINQLIDFNEENFGDSDYRTASSYYLSGIFQHEFEPIIAYQHLVKSSEIFTRSKYTNEDLEGYALTLSPVYPYMWSIKSFNAILNFAFEGSYVDPEKAKNIISVLRESIDESMESLYRRNVQIIHDGIETSKKHDNINMDGMLKVAESFYHTFPITISMYDNETGLPNYVECSHASVKYRNLGLLYSTNPNDSILTFENNAQTYSNLSLVIDSTDSDSLQKIDEIIYNLRKDAFDIAIHHKTYVFRTFNSYLEDYYYNRTNPLYNKEEFKNRFNKLDKIFSNLMMMYRSEEDQSFANNALDRYILVMQYLINENVVDGEDEILKFTEHNIKIVMNDKEEGYGHYNMVEAYNYKANQCLKLNKIEEAKRMYLDILDHIDNNKLDWILSESDKEEYNDINEIIFVKYSYAFNNYMLTMWNEFQEEYTLEDSIMIVKCENFIETNKDVLLSYNLFYPIKVSMLHAKIFYYWYDNQYIKESELSDFDEVINIYERLNNNIELRNPLGWDDVNPFSAAKIETATDKFLTLKIQIIDDRRPYKKDKNTELIIQTNNQLIKTAEQWKEKEKIFPIIDAYESMYREYFKNGDFRESRNIAKKGYQHGISFLEKDDFTWFANPKLAKSLLLMNTGKFLSHLTGETNKPSIDDRKQCINHYKELIKFIQNNWEEDELDDNLIERLRKSSYFIADQYYFLNDFEASIEYHKYQLEYSRMLSDTTSRDFYVRHSLDNLYVTEYKSGDIEAATNYYIDVINHTNWVDTSDIYSYSLIDKQIGECLVPFIELKIYTMDNVWPTIEVDVNNNNKIDSDIDLRYFIDIDDKINVEYIKSLEQQIGGYQYFGYDKNNLPRDTTSQIFFDNSDQYNSAAYVAKDNISKKIVWTFMIPISELKTDTNSDISLLISNVTYNPYHFVLSRNYEKITFPPKSFFTGFNNSITIK